MIDCALAAGAHVLVEKPLTPSAEATERLLERAAAHGRIVHPVHQTAYQRWLPQIERVGELLALEYQTCSAASGPEPDRIVDEILPHSLSLFERIRPGSLEDLAWQAARSRPGELHALAVHRGVRLSLSISLGARPTRHELCAVGARGTLVADLFHGFAWFEPGAESRRYKMRPLVTPARP